MSPHTFILLLSSFLIFTHYYCNTRVLKLKELLTREHKEQDTRQGLTPGASNPMRVSGCWCGAWRSSAKGTRDAFEVAAVEADAGARLSVGFDGGGPESPADSATDLGKLDDCPSVSMLKSGRSRPTIDRNNRKEAYRSRGKSLVSFADTRSPIVKSSFALERTANERTMLTYNSILSAY